MAVQHSIRAKIRRREEQRILLGEVGAHPTSEPTGMYFISKSLVTCGRLILVAGIVNCHAFILMAGTVSGTSGIGGIHYAMGENT